jgi:hypothetical protein
MLNSGNKFRAVRDIKIINILTLVLSEKKILNETMLNIFLLFLKFQFFQTDVRSFEITSIFNAKIV